MIEDVMGLMGVCSTIFSSIFIFLSFTSKSYRKVFLIFAIAFGISTWGLFEYAIYLAGSDILLMIFHPGILIPFLSFFFSSIALFLFLIYVLFKNLKRKI
jgi:hypothetical protein